MKMQMPISGGKSTDCRAFQLRRFEEAQAGTAATGGGRVKSANVERATGRRTGARLWSTVTTTTGGAGAGACAMCTVMWATAHSEQSA